MHCAADLTLQRLGDGDTTLANEAFGTVIEVQNGVPIAVERAMYWNPGGLVWAGGTYETGIRLP